MTAKEQKERDRLHRKWATQPPKMSWRELDRCRQLDRKARAEAQANEGRLVAIRRLAESLLKSQD